MSLLQGTLVVCPVIALTQWKTEIEKFTDGSLTVGTYHGPDRESQTPREMLKKYDVVLTTYQVVEADFRKMTSPNRVECPNCGGKYKLDKLPIHLKYFCGDGAMKTEAQARQRRNSDRDGPARGRRGRRPDRAFGKSDGKDKKDVATKDVKEEVEVATKQRKRPEKTTANNKILSKPKRKDTATKQVLTNDQDEIQTGATSRRSSSRGAARKAASIITKSAAEWMPPDGDSFSEVQEPEWSTDEGSERSGESSDVDTDNSALLRARAKQQQALEKARKSKAKNTTITKGRQKKGEKLFTKKGKKKFDDDYGDDSSSSDDSDGDVAASNDIDMDELVRAAMAGGKFVVDLESYTCEISFILKQNYITAKNSVLHSLCWWRIILGEQRSDLCLCLIGNKFDNDFVLPDEAHFIKTRSSQTANAAFSLIGVHRWCLSGTPLQNRVGEKYLISYIQSKPTN